MRSIVTFLMMCALPHMNLFSQQSSWQWDNPLPQGNILNSLWTVSKDTAYAVGDYGTVIRTSNGGVTWQVIPSAGGMLDPLFAVQFSTPSTGWAGGSTGQIVKTTDGGITWYYQTLPTLNDIYSISFISSTTGWIAGGGGIMFGTTDGGITWAAESTKTTQNLYSVQFINATTGWAVGAGGTILKSTDSGASWVTQTSGTSNPLYSLSFTSPTTGYAAGAFGTVLKTLNGGITWVPQSSGIIYALFGLNFANATTGWTLGSFGTILKTTNGGSTWFQQTSGTYNDLEAVRFVSPSIGWAVGDYGTILRTTDGGTTWTTQSSGVKNPINATHFPTPTVGFGVGDEGTIIRTLDGGLTWTQVPSGVFQPLYGVYFLNTTTGYAVGDSAVILRTTNGGTSWVEGNSRTDISLYSIFFANASSGWAVGDFGTILATTNGGTSWVPQTAPTTATLQKVRFASPTVGWAVGYSGTILKTINGGVNWISQTSTITQTLYSLDIVDPNRVCTVGDFGTALRTTDGGITWSLLTTGVDASLYGVAFYSANNGWAAGDDGTIVGTTDGGTTWSLQNSGTPQSLWEMQLSRRTSGGVLFASGFGGTIVCSTVGPYNVKTWAGTFSSLWTTAENWNPVGPPEKGDSVVVPSTTQTPFIGGNVQQLELTSLYIGPGAKLNIGSGLAKLSVKGNIRIDGTLELDSTAKTEIVTGGDFIMSFGGRFSPARSTVYFTNPGSIRGSFYNVLLAPGADIQTVGNVTIQNQFTTLADIHLRAIDTLTILSNDPSAFQGSAITGPGTIRRSIRQGSTDPYRFESAVTTLRFHPTGVYPDTITMTVFPNTLFPGLPDTAFVKRYYSITAHGGNGFLADLSLRYDTAESTIPIENIGLFRDSSGVVLSKGQSDYLDSDVVAIILDSVSTFSKWYLGSLDYIPKHPFQFKDTLRVTDNGAQSGLLVYGAMPTATDGIDPTFGEVVLGPKPPSGTFDARWTIPSTLGALTNIKDVLTSIRLQNVYDFSFQPGSGGYPVTLRWNPANFTTTGVYLLRDGASGGTQFSIDMRTRSSYVITNPAITTVQIAHVGPNYFSYRAGWNIVSLPRTQLGDASKAHLYPTAVSNAFLFDNGYIKADTLRPGIGYWIKFPSNQTLGTDGIDITRDTIDVQPGWNMIGAISKAVAVTAVGQIPSGTLTGSFFQFASGYATADTLKPSRGYWVKALNQGKLVLSDGTLMKPAMATGEPLEQLAKFIISDADGNEQSLYVADASDRVDPREYELPPPPPAGAFDARFTSNRIVEKTAPGHQDVSISLHASAYPLTVRWESGIHPMPAFAIRDQSTGKTLIEASSASGSFRIDGNSVGALAVRFSGGNTVPQSFALHQNYPNPFNPATRIDFDLPVAARVNLTVYSVLGQEIAGLLRDNDLVAGRHSMSFNAAALSTGLYFVRMTAVGSDGARFSESRKMLLVR